MNTNLRSFFMASVVFLMPLVLFAQGISGTWSTASSDGFTGRDGLSSSEVGGKIYVIGGWGSTGPLNTLEVFDPSTNSWSTPQTSGIFNPRYAHCAGVVGGKIYIIGGGDLYGLVGTVGVFDPSTNTWSSPSTTGTFTERIFAAASVVDGKIYVMGGNSDTGILNTLEIFDPSTNTWSTPQTKGTFTPRTWLTSCVVNGKIYAIGGANTMSLNTFEIFDPVANVWSTPEVGGFLSPRHALSSVVIDSNVYLVGGIQGGVSEWFDSVVVFDHITSSWSTIPLFGKFTVRSSLCASAVGRKIYAMGGVEGPKSYLNTNEVFTLSTSEVKSAPFSNDLQLSPNPTAGIISISNASLNTQRISITNILGETVIESANPQTPNFSLDLSKLAPGVYYARFISLNSVVVKKIIRQ